MAVMAPAFCVASPLSGDQRPRRAGHEASRRRMGITREMAAGPVISHVVFHFDYWAAGS
jgi:hypothetical protein